MNIGVDKVYESHIALKQGVKHLQTNSVAGDSAARTGNNARKTKGQQLKGKIVSALFTLCDTFTHIFTLFLEFSRIFLQDFFLELWGFTTV